MSRCRPCCATSEAVADRAGFRSTRYDFRGSGLSDRDSIDFSMSAMLRDLEAVADRAGGSEFAMYTVNDGGPIAISYAAANPERLSHLVLIDSWARFSDYTQSPAIQAETMLRAQDWMIYTETVAKVLIGYEDPGFAESLAEHIRASVEPEALRAAYSRIQDGDWDGYQQDCHNGAHDCPDAAPYSRSRARPLRHQPRRALPSRRVKGYRSDT